MELIMKKCTVVSVDCPDCRGNNHVFHQDFTAGAHYHCSHCQATVQIDAAQANEARDLLYADVHDLGKPRSSK